MASTGRRPKLKSGPMLPKANTAPPRPKAVAGNSTNNGAGLAPRESPRGSVDSSPVVGVMSSPRTVTFADPIAIRQRPASPPLDPAPMATREESASLPPEPPLPSHPPPASAIGPMPALAVSPGPASAAAASALVVSPGPASAAAASALVVSSGPASTAASALVVSPGPASAAASSASQLLRQLHGFAVHTSRLHATSFLLTMSLHGQQQQMLAHHDRMQVASLPIGGWLKKGLPL